MLILVTSYLPDYPDVKTLKILEQVITSDISTGLLTLGPKWRRQDVQNVF